MSQYDIENSTTTNFDNTVNSYSVDTAALDYANDTDETYYDFPKATEYIGYYKKIPELKKAVDALAMWTVGKGWDTELSSDKVILEKLTGWGEDTIDSILENMIIMKWIAGDSFAEIIRKDDRIINIKPISPERVRIVTDKKGRIKRYEIKGSKGHNTPIQPKDMFHLCNNRVGDEIHGTSAIEACKWVIDARNEAMEASRKVINRTKAIGIAYYDTDNTGKIEYANQAIEKAVNNGEMLGLPKDTVEIAEFPDKNTTDVLGWIRYLENFFYQAVGIPKIILGGSQEFTEASSKVGYLTFEQVYMSEQRKLEQDIWNQTAIRIKFERPVSLKDNIQSDEEANTGQTSIQEKEGGINLERE